MKKRLLLFILIFIIGFVFNVTGQLSSQDIIGGGSQDIIGGGGTPECFEGEVRSCAPVDCANGYGQQRCTDLFWADCECVINDCYEKPPYLYPSFPMSEQLKLVWNGTDYGLGGYTNFLAFNTDGTSIGNYVNLRTLYPNANVEALTWNGSVYGIVYSAIQRYNFTTIDGEGKIGIEKTVTEYKYGNLNNPSLIWNGSEYGLAWAQGFNDDVNIYFTRFYPNGTKIIGDVLIGKGIVGFYRHANTPALAWNGKNYAIAWKMRDDLGNYNIGFSILNYDGSIGTMNRVNVLDASVTDLVHSEGDKISVIWTGTEYGITWTNRIDEDIYFTRFNKNGAKINTADTRINSTKRSLYPSVGWSGKEYVVVWWESSNGYARLARLYQNGSKIAGNSYINLGRSYLIGGIPEPALVWNGNGFGIAVGNQSRGYFINYNNIPCPLCEPEGSTQDCTTIAYTLTNAPDSCKGTQTCTNKNWGACDVQTPAETCNGLDDNCDGVIDNIIDLNTKQDGECVGSTKKCVNGVATDDYSTIINYESTETSCTDTLDNDCDGLVDSGDSDCITAGDCSDCSGIGCDSTMCHTKGDCYWVDTGIGGLYGDCFDVADALSCYDFDYDGWVCNSNDLHGFGCIYDDVDKLCDFSCGNGDIDEGIGENCLTCQEDAGCTSGYCQADPSSLDYGKCTGTPDTTTCDDPPDGICDPEETCACSDCYDEQAGCFNGYICDSNGGGCVVDSGYNPNVCAEPNEPCYCSGLGNNKLDGMTCDPEDFCKSTHSTRTIPYIQFDTRATNTERCCVGGLCGGVTIYENGVIVNYESSNCINGEKIITFIEKTNGIITGTSQEIEPCGSETRKLQLPFLGLNGIIITLMILTGFYLLRFSKKD